MEEQPSHLFASWSYGTLEGELQEQSFDADLEEFLLQLSLAQRDTSPYAYSRVANKSIELINNAHYSGMLLLKIMHLN